MDNKRQVQLTREEFNRIDEIISNNFWRGFFTGLFAGIFLVVFVVIFNSV